MGEELATVGIPLRSMDRDHTLFIRSPGSTGLVNVPASRLSIARTKVIHIAKDPLLLNRASRYLDVLLRSPRPSVKIHGFDSFEFDPIRGIRSYRSPFDKYCYGIKINQTAH